MPVSTQNRGAVHCQLPDTAELQWGALKGKKTSWCHPRAELGTVHLSWLHWVSLQCQGLASKSCFPVSCCGVFCSSPSEVIMACHISFGKIYFARFPLQFARALLAPHCISCLTGTCSKGRIYVVWFSVQIWFCSCWAKTLTLDSSGSNAWTHSILILFFLRFIKCIKVAYKQSINNSVANKLLALYVVWYYFSLAFSLQRDQC